MSQVADAAGVSQATVSFVLNGRERANGSISPETKRRVHEAAEHLGYDRNIHRNARQMAARKHGVKILNNVIAISAATSLDNPELLHDRPYESEVLHGIEAAASQYGLDILLCRHYENKLPRLLERREVDGIICLISTPQSLQQITELGVPVVKLVSGCEHSHNITVANFQGVYDVVQHLASLGHRNIAYIGHGIAYDAPESILLGASRERFAGYEQAMKDAGLPVEYTDFSLGVQTLAATETAMGTLWEKSGGTITAVVCYHDVLAMRAIHWLKKRGLRVPQDVSVTGFDDVSEQYFFDPLITSVHYDRTQLGRRAVEILWHSRTQWLADEKMDLTHEVLPVELKVRASTALPRTKEQENH